MSLDTVFQSIVSAASVGAVSAANELSRKAITDAYDSLKQIIGRRFGKQSEVTTAISKLEEKPDSAGRREVLREELESTGIEDDQEIVAVAKRLLLELKQNPTSTIRIQIAQGSAIAQASEGSTAKVRIMKTPHD